VGLTARYLAVGTTLCLAALTASAGVASWQHGSRTAQRVYSTPSTRPLATGLADPALFNSAQRKRAFAMSHSAGVKYVRIGLSWRAIAPETRPDGFVADDPTSPGYSWAGLDATVEAAASAHVTPILNVTGTPRWAYAKRPKDGNAGTPKASALGDFAKALARHYDGSDGLPVEHVFQVWNEPNLSLDMSPVSANAYRGMVNAVADAVHSVDASNVVIAGALDPFGHKKTSGQTWYSIRPLAFMRSLLCLSKGSHPHSTCSAQIRFDIWSHHPYSYGGPWGRAKIVDDVEIGDLPQMRALLKAGVRLHHVVSVHPVQFWVTEFGWNTKPPRPNGAPLGLASRWTAESLHQMWLSGISLVTWFLLEDYPRPSHWNSGLFFHASSLSRARPKPMRTAFRFPFVAYLEKRNVSLWGRVATSDTQVVTIQQRHGKRGAWRTVARVRSNQYGIFKATLKLKATKKDWLRAVATGSGKSLAFSLTRPAGSNIAPFS
jgi:hypothetical protein